MRERVKNEIVFETYQRYPFGGVGFHSFLHESVHSTLATMIPSEDRDFPPEALPAERTPLLKNDGAPSASGSELGSSATNDADDKLLVREPSTARALIIMSILYFGTVLSAVDATVVATLSAPISSEFGSLSLLAWVASAYIIATAAVLPLSGKLTDIFGRRAGLLWCNFFFGLGNLTCGLARTEGAMIVGRVVAGLGGGGLNSISTFVASDLIPVRRRGVWQGFGNLAWGVGSALGGILGGWVHDLIGWRWMFLALVPATMVSVVLVWCLVDIPVQEKDGRSKIQRVDFAGALVLVASLVVLLVGLNAAGNTVPWNHPLVLVSLPLSAVLFALFVYIEASFAVEPIIPVGLMRHVTVAAACLANWLAAMATYGLIFYGPIYFQVRGLPAMGAGARLVPLALGVAVGSIGTGLVMRAVGRYWWLNVGVQFVYVLGFALSSTFSLNTPLWTPFVYFSVAGVGHGGMLTITLLALIAAVDQEWQAIVTSASYAFRSTGSVIGIAVSSLVFQNLLRDGLWARLGDRDGADRIIPEICDSLDYLKTLPEPWRTEALGAYIDALHGVFLTLLGLAFAAGLTSVFMREHKLHSSINRREPE
jgi:MFS family permease